MDKDNALVRITACADLLAQHSKIHYLSVALTVGVMLTSLLLAGLGLLSLAGMLGSLLVVVLGLAQLRSAVRVGFDTALLRQLAQSTLYAEQDLQSLDHALIALQLMPAEKAGRSLDARLQGCLRLFKQQAVWCALQLLTLLCLVIWIR